MEDTVDLFSRILDEKGVDAQVSESKRARSVGAMATELMVMKRIGSKKWGYKVVVPDRSTLDSDEVFLKRLERYAEDAKQQFESETTIDYQWLDYAVKVSKYDGGWVKCRHCDDKKSFEGLRNVFTSFDGQELGTPQSFSRYRDEVISDLEGNEEVLFNLYMLGAIKHHSCNCPAKFQRGQLPKDL